MTSRQLLNRATPYIFMAPAVLVMLVALAYPLVQSIWLSFHQWAIGAPLSSATFIGLENYRILLSDPNVWASIRVTLVFAFAVVVVEVALGVALALVLDRQIRGMSVFRTIFILPMMVAPIVVGLVWRYLYNEQFGPFTTTLKALGLPVIPWLSSPDMALASVIIADVWQWTPFIFILSLAALQSLPASAIEAARIDGASRWQTILHVKLPLMVPVIVVAALLRLIDAFKVLEVIYILTEGGPGLSTEILSLHIYKTAFTSQQLGRASALSNILLLIVTSLTLALFIFTKLREEAARRAAQAEES
jgi:multiple sugar transport system permease protein